MAEHLYWHADTQNRWRLYDERTREPTEDWVDLPEGVYPVRERETSERLLHEQVRLLREESAALGREFGALREFVETQLRP